MACFRSGEVGAGLLSSLCPHLLLFIIIIFILFSLGYGMARFSWRPGVSLLPSQSLHWSGEVYLNRAFTGLARFTLTEPSLVWRGLP
jgi:hypothetical protein